MGNTFHLRTGAGGRWRSPGRSVRSWKNACVSLPGCSRVKPCPTSPASSASPARPATRSSIATRSMGSKPSATAPAGPWRYANQLPHPGREPHRQRSSASKPPLGRPQDPRAARQAPSPGDVRTARPKHRPCRARSPWPCEALAKTRRNKRHGHDPRLTLSQPNALWCADFKGEFTPRQPPSTVTP